MRKPRTPEQRERENAARRGKPRSERERMLHRIFVREHYLRNRQIYLDKAKAWAKANPDKRTKIWKSWRENNPEKQKQISNKQNRKNEANLQKRIRHRLGKRLWDAVKNGSKSARTLQLLGCDIDWLMAWLEVQFQQGMTWDNYGYKGWHIDHKRPCASFDLVDADQQRLCFHWTNLQPLWEAENIRKSDNLVNN